ncbi:MAG: FKBP-type peptidyl-prolyl cis-trans isomerase [Ancrocorticia sp.]
MKKPSSKILAALLCGALSFSLVACSNDDSDSASSSSSASAQAGEAGSTEAPTVDRDPAGELPEVTFADGKPTMKSISADPPTSISVKTLKAGDGEAVQPGGYVTVNYAGFLWKDGTQFDSSFDRGQSTTFSLNQVVDGWKYGLEGTKVGDQVLVVVPPEFGYGDTDQGEIPGGSTLVFVVDILGVVNPSTEALSSATATGAELPAGLEIAGEIGQEPTITYAEGAEAPAEAQVVVLAEGTGAAITETDTLMYLAVSGYWGQETSSAWPDSFQQIGQGGGAEMVGKTVGSRVLLTYPKDEATGAEAQVLVVDIVAAIPAA